MPARVRAKQEARRTQILEAAAKVFARKGFEGATISEIARAAGLAEGSIYNYFRSKEDLLVHIPRQFVQPVLKMWTPAAGGPRSPEEAERQLLGLIGAMAERLRSQTPFLKVFVSALPYLSPAARRQYMRIPTAAAERLEEFLRAGMGAGVFRQDLNSTIASRALPGMLMAFVLMQEIMLGQRLIPYDYGTIVAEVVRLFLYGAVPRGETTRTPSSQGGRT
ncbi:MAG: TetR/AcrR family transcriptional regulator [Armatimonadota bacterium]|nr:TetR/AcrR family transcriptional regulator [Armatimonadota bacterium]MDR7505779.1 TetR/AcrR family transcriptional regulator [Armatimonadota bacterium]MDR7553304.1 TetR/AcrR family transcriptional regulator [Armatimonadota bacterium]